MEDATRFMLNVIFSVTSGYPDGIMEEYADVFQKILDNDKLLQGKKWGRRKTYEAVDKYFNKKAGK